jgi:hypothetical protein
MCPALSMLWFRKLRKSHFHGISCYLVSTVAQPIGAFLVISGMVYIETIPCLFDFLGEWNRAIVIRQLKLF